MNPTPQLLDTRTALAKIDTSNMLGSIEALADQAIHAWQEIKKITYQPQKPIHNLVIAGMGGSGLGADVIKYAFKDILNLPLDIVHEYTLPAYVNENTLVLLASYSGTTEEILACAKQAEQQNAQCAVLAAGGTLLDLAKQKNRPYYQIVPTHNPCNQPRMAIGYAVFGTIGLLAQVGLLTISDNEIEAVAETIKSVVNRYTVEVPQDRNTAKMLAFAMLDRHTVFVAAEFLEGAIHVATNQTNENAKFFADYKIVPEMNHHLLEGLRFPISNPHTNLFIFINSYLYSPRNQARIRLTKTIVEANDIEGIMIDLAAESKLSQVFELITLCSFTSYYLAMLEGIDPSPIPFVEDFKKGLDKA